MDPISNFLTQIRNTILAGNTSAKVPYSKTKERLAEVLVRLGYIENIETEGKDTKKTLSFDIKRDEYGEPKIKGLKRASKLSRREYVGYRDIKLVKQGHGNVILSTPRGILTGQEARKEKVGGEALFKVW
jgi:small subunit ribosomal protein S8